MKQYNCKNCGAPIKHSYNHHCEYCGTLIDFNVPEEKVTRVSAEDLYDIKIRIERRPEFMTYLIILTGYKLKMPTIYEYTSDFMTISEVQQYINPPRCSICIEIDDKELRYGGIEYLMWRIKNINVRREELGKIKNQIVEELTNQKIWIYGINMV